MVFDCRFISRSTAFQKGRTSSTHGTRVRRRDSLGIAHWCAVERSAPKLPVAADVLASLQSLDRSRHLESSLGATLAQARSPRAHPLARSNGRRYIFLSEKGGSCVGKTKRGKGTKTMVLVDGRGLPLGAEIASASPHEVTLIEPLLGRRILPTKPRRLIYDAAADSDPLRARLAKRGIELVSPHRKNRKKPPTQDGRKLRRYRRRWKIERSIGWLQNFRRLVTRYEYYAHLFHGFVQLACLMVVMRRF
jgi:transposase